MKVPEPSVLPLLPLRSNPAAFSPTVLNTHVAAIEITMVAALPTRTAVQCLVPVMSSVAPGVRWAPPFSGGRVIS